MPEGGSIMHTPERLDTIRRLNDAALQHPGTASVANATTGFHALPDADRFAALAAIVGFTKFDGDNDHYGEHDFGAIYRLASGMWTQDRPSGDKAHFQTVVWKIDYYDPTHTSGTKAPWEEGTNKRGRNR